MKPKRNKAKRSKPQTSRADRWRGDFRKPNAGEAFLGGLNGLRESLASPHVHIEAIWANPNKLSSEGFELIKPHMEMVEKTPAACPYGELQQGVGTLVRLPQWPSLEDLLERDGEQAPFWVVLDQVEDPMNLGQMLRTCEGAGVNGVIVPGRRAAHLNQTVAQVSQGAFAWVPLITVGNLRQALETMKSHGLWLVGCERVQGAKPWMEMDLTMSLAIVMGAEGSGLRELTRNTCDFHAFLPMQGRLDSLNVGAALSAFLYEVIRQRS